MYNIRIQLFCLFLGLSGLIFSNVKDTTEIQTQQNEHNNFYIKDDGSVAYVETQNVVDSVASLKVDSKSIAIVDTVTKKTEPQVVFFTKERKAEVSKDLTIDETSASSQSEVVEKNQIPETSLFSGLHKAVPIPIEIKHTAKAIEDSLVVPSGVASGYVVKEDKIPERDSLSEAVSSETNEEYLDYEGYTPSYKRESSYKNLEEATLASDRLLAQLKRKQTERNQPTSKSGSLSFRVVKGGDYVRTTSKGDFGNKTSNNSSDFDYETDYGNEPTYYINGVRVEKSDVLKLRKKNILSRTMKLKDTASRNPNGEIWFEVKE